MHCQQCTVNNDERLCIVVDVCEKIARNGSVGQGSDAHSNHTVSDSVMNSDMVARQARLRAQHQCSRRSLCAVDIRTV